MTPPYQITLFEITDNRAAQRLTADSVKRVFSNINPRKAAGPDHIPGCVLKECSEQLKDDIFNISLSQECPSVLKAPHGEVVA